MNPIDHHRAANPISRTGTVRAASSVRRASLHRGRRARWTAGLVVTALLAASCAPDDAPAATPAPAAAESAGTGGSTASTMAQGTHRGDDGHAATDVSIETPAAQLRAGLTALLQEHVYLAGLAINQAVADGGDLTAPATASAVATLDANSVALSEAVGSVYGPEAGEQFLALWRAHIGFFVDYTLGGATGDVAAQEAAREKLDGYRAEFGAFIEGATDGGLPGDAVAADLQTHVESLTVAIDAVLAGSPDVYPTLRAAAGHMPMTAATLAGAIVEQDPEAFAG